MRLLVVSDRLPPHHRGGAGSVLVELVDHLGRAGHEVEVVRGGRSTRERASLELAVRAAGRRVRPDAALSLGPSLAGLDCPTLSLGVSEDDAPAAPGALGSIRTRLRRTRRQASPVLVPTPPSASLLARGRPSRVAPPGVDTARFAPSAAPDGPLRVVFLGRLVPTRGAHLALEAWAGLPGWARDKATLSVVGAPDDRVYLDRLKRLAAPLDVPIHQDVADVLPHLQGAALAMLPRTGEDGWGRAILEAMACGVPVLTSTGGVLEVLTGGAAEHVPAANVKALGESLRALLRSDGRRLELAEAGRAHVVARHSWDVVLPAWERALR